MLQALSHTCNHHGGEYIPAPVLPHPAHVPLNAGAGLTRSHNWSLPAICSVALALVGVDHHGVRKEFNLPFAQLARCLLGDVDLV